MAIPARVSSILSGIRVLGGFEFAFGSNSMSRNPGGGQAPVPNKKSAHSKERSVRAFGVDSVQG
jgi:hypothetical protein